VRWAERGADGEVLLEATYGDFRPLGAVAFPHAMDLRDPRTEAAVRVAWSRVELNPALDPALFAVPAADAP
jgi:hypothetical protein